MYQEINCIFQNKEFFLTETSVLNSCNFNIAKNVNVLVLHFEKNVNIYEVTSFKDFEKVIFVSK